MAGRAGPSTADWGGDSSDFEYEPSLDSDSDSFFAEASFAAPDFDVEMVGLSSQKRARQTETTWKKGDFSPTVFPFDVPDHLRAQLFNRMRKKLIISSFFFCANRFAHCDRNEPVCATEDKRTRSCATSWLKAWVETDVEEMYCFLAVVLQMGLVKKDSLQDYWSTNPMSHTLFFVEPIPAPPAAPASK